MTSKKFVWDFVLAAAILVVPLSTARPAYADESSTTTAVSVSSSHAVTRPAALVPLYIAFGTLQTLDAVSTLRNVRNGATEANPVMQPVAGSPAALMAAKCALAGVSFYATEKLWRSNRAAAIAVMFGLNSVTAMVVAHNLRQHGR